MENIILTGIKPTGSPHLGNYLGAIKPSLAMAKSEKHAKKYFFIADYHALTTVKDSELMKQYRNIVACTWLSFFQDVPGCAFYFQSDIPEIFELYWILSCFCPKGLLNRAHAYKGFVADNMSKGRDPDDKINQGLFSYPVLMAADILLFHSNKIPIGPDQKQHVEIANEIVRHLNKYLPNPIPEAEPMIDNRIETIIGTDGQKMSKNYDNTIPLFAGEKELKKKISRIITDTTPLGEPLNPDTCNIFKLLSYIASPKDLDIIRGEYVEGAIGYGHAKQRLLGVFLDYFSEYRDRYEQLMSDPSILSQRIMESTGLVRKIATKNLLSIRQALGF